MLAYMWRGALLQIALGLLAACRWLQRRADFLGTSLFGVAHCDPSALPAAILALSLSALAPVLIPAFRPSSASPIQALRVE